MKKIIVGGMNIITNLVLGIATGLVLFITVAFTNPWVALPFVEADPIPREWFAESVIAVKEWHCMNSDEYQITGIAAEVLLGEGAGKTTREALCDHYNENDFWGTIGFGR